MIPATTYPTTHLRYACVPSAASLYELVSSIIDENAFTATITGMLLAWPFLVVACAVASLLAIAWVLLGRLLATRQLLAPVTIGLCLASLAFLSIALWARAIYLSTEAFADNMPVLQGSVQVAFNTDMSVALAVVTTTFAVGVVIALWCGLLHRLLQTGGILREAHEAFAMMPSLLWLLPPILIALLAALFAYWLVVASYLASAGRPTHGFVHYDVRLQSMTALITAGVLWTAEMVLHLGFCTSAGAVARGISPAESPGKWQGGGVGVVRLLLLDRLVCRRLLLVIPGRLFRFLLEHCLHQAQTDGKGKPELRCVTQCCLRCCLDRSTRFLQYISHTAYIYVAVHDLTFAEGARQAFELTLRNIGQVAVLTAGERLLLTLAKLAVACTCTGGAAIVMSIHFSVETAIENANGALCLIFVATFCVADAWLAAFDAACEAIFLCYLVDQEENDGDVRPYYASPTLQRYMEKHRPSLQLPAATPPAENGEAQDDKAQ